MTIPLDPKHTEALTFQQYGPAPTIDGVFYHPLSKHRALEGDFMEFLRITDGKADGLPIEFEPRQVSVARAEPNRINAFHVHPKVVQDEFWCVIDGAMLVWLADVRDGSPTEGARRSFLLSGEQPGLLYIPAGVAHGYHSGPDGAMLLYVMNSQFDATNPNEGRLPWDYFGAELWETDRG